MTVVACAAAVGAVAPAPYTVMGDGVPARTIRTFTVPGLSTETSTAAPSRTSNRAEKVIPGVVSVVSRLRSQNASVAGTGMVLRSSGEVLTNNHVVQDAASVTVTVAGTGRAFAAKVVGTDAGDDVAVLQLQGATGLTVVPIGDSSKVAVGDSVAAVGNAEGGTPSVVEGTVQALNQSITATDSDGGNAEQLTGLIKSNAPIRPGFSGGPLVSAVGEVIGMDTAATVFNEYLPAGLRAGYSIPISHAVSVATRIESGQGTAAGAGTAAGGGQRAARAARVLPADDRHRNGVGDAGEPNPPTSPARILGTQENGGLRQSRRSRRGTTLPSGPGS